MYMIIEYHFIWYQVYMIFLYIVKCFKTIIAIFTIDKKSVYY